MNFKVLCIVILSLTCSIYFTSSSFAASQYDDTIKVTNDLILQPTGSRSHCNADDVTDSFFDYLNSAIQRSREKYRDEYIANYNKLMDIVNNPDRGYWALTMQGDYILAFYFVAKDDFKSATVTDSVHLQAKDNKVIYRFILTPQGSCDLDVLVNTYSGSDRLLYSRYEGVHSSHRWFANTFPIEYPNGYEGIKLSTWVKPKDTYFGEYKPPKYENCDALNIACHIGNFFKFILSFFDGLIAAIKYLFLPDFTKISSYISSAFNSFWNSLGFLRFPFELSVKFISSINSALSFSYSNNLCYWADNYGFTINNLPDGTDEQFSLVGGKFFGASFRPYAALCDFSLNYPLFLKFIRVVVQTLILVALYFTTRDKLFNILGGNVK